MKCLAALVLTLSAVGIHGLVAWSVALRTREFSIRMAVGGQPSDVVRLIAWETSRLFLAGLGAGTLLSLMLIPLVRNRLVGISPLDPMTYATVVAILVLPMSIASYLPVYRAARIDPLQVLRHE